MPVKKSAAPRVSSVRFAPRLTLIRSVIRPGRITEVIDVDLGSKRNEDTRAADGFFRSITAVREALRGTHAEHAAANAIRGVEDR